MAYVLHEDAIGVPMIGNLDTVKGASSGRVVRARDTTYGEGEFMYLQATATIAAGQVVTYNQYNNTAILWTGTAGGGAPLAVANAAMVSGQWGYFQVSGATVTAISGTVAAGNPMYWQANGVLSATQVNGKQVIGAIAGSANGVPSAGFAIVILNRPAAQSQVV